jgi:hypothetical protein
MGRLTLIGAFYITLVCLLTEFLILKFNTPFYFGGTSLLIIVVVTMDFMTQVQSHLMSLQYEGLLKKANFKDANLVQAMFGPPEMVNSKLMFSPLGTHLNYGAEMDDACFVNADLSSAMFRETYFPRADFTGAKMEGANFKHTAFDK